MAEIFFGDFCFDTRKLTLAGPGGPVEMRAKTRELFLYLVEHRNRFVSRNELLDQIWAGVHVGDASLTQCISELRHVFGDSGKEQRYIETRIKSGYRFIAPVFHKPTDRLELLPAPVTVPPPRTTARIAWPWIAGAAGGVVVVGVALFLWLNARPDSTRLALGPVVREDASESTRVVSAGLERLVETELRKIPRLAVQRIDGASAGRRRLELRCRTVGGIVEATATLREPGSGLEIWGWTWSVPAVGDDVRTLAPRVARAVAEAVRERI